MLVAICLHQVAQDKQFSTFAQPKIEESTSHSNNQTESKIDTVPLNKFTFFEYLKTAAKAYTDPQGLSDKSLVYFYEATDSNFLEALDEIDNPNNLNGINHDQLEILMSGWFIGPAELNKNGIGIVATAMWTPWPIQQFKSEAKGMALAKGTTSYYASNLPIPGQKVSNTYWIPHSTYGELLNSFQLNSVAMPKIADNSSE